MTSFKRGDIVLADMGMAAKVRPCLVVSISSPDRRRNMSVVAPLTTEIRGGQTEIRFAKPRWLAEESVVNLLGIAGLDNAKIIRMLAPFPPDRMPEVDAGLARMLGLK